ncbi:hypothetical protein, partial [Streptomyces anulatus]|uniref:hypothetical protein n=1 Tax=Streptomyces anulatus TaxID=1892 RepID=UPI00364B8635
MSCGCLPPRWSRSGRAPLRARSAGDRPLDENSTQTTAAAQAAVLLREAATLTTGARTTTPRPAAWAVPRTVRVTPAPERGPATPPPVTGVPPRHANGP